MDLKDLLAAALTLVVGFAVKWLFAQLGLELDEATFNAIVAGIVAWLLGLFFVAGIRAAVRGTRAAKFLPEK